MSATLTSTRILVADDDPAIVETVSWALREHGYDVVPAVDGATMLAAMEQREPDLLLLDILMPDADGCQLLARLKSDDRWRDVPVLMISSLPVEEATVKSLGLGAADFIRKPFRVRELIARIQSQLRQGAMLRTTRDELRRTEAELARAKEDAESRRKLVDILHEVTGDLSSNEIYHILARRVARALSVSHCSVILARPGDKAGVVATAFENPKLQNMQVQLERYPEIQAALATGQPVLIEDIATSPLYDEVRAGWGLEGLTVNIRSVIALPFTLDRRQSGVFFLRRTNEQPPLTREDVAFADAAIRAATAVIQRAQVIETTRADNARLEQLATTDPLTTLLNRRALTERLTREMERALRYDTTLALLMIDLDHFKRINDTHGHLMGDDVLRDIASLLRETARASDLVGRYGGEEFLVVLTETDEEGALRFAERIREQIEAGTFGARADGQGLQATASIGLASFPAARIESVEDLFARADAALYRAKAEGRNRVRV